MKYNKAFMLIIIISIISLSVLGCSNVNEQPEKASEAVDENAEIKIIASTSWTALIAEAASGQDVEIIAPVELKHPPEYDFKPSDIERIQGADHILMAGYEPFMNKLLQSNDIDETKIIQVRTTNTYDNLVAQTKAIAEKLGTEEAQEKWEEEFSTATDEIMEKAKAKGVKNMKVLAHTHMVDFAKSLGFEVVEIFGAEEMSPAKIGELANLDHALIIDNYHNPQGMAIAEISKAERVELRNFPGPNHGDLIDLFKDNAKILGLY